MSFWKQLFGGPRQSNAAGVHAAVENADIGRLKNLLQDQPELIEARDDDGKTLLHRVADYLSETSSPGHRHILTFLLTNGARVNTKSRNQFTPLHQLSYFGIADVVALFLDHGAEVDAREKRNQTPLEYAALQGHTAVIELLVQRGADPNASDQMGRVSLHCAAENGHVSAARALLARGAKLNVADLKGFSPFYLAVEHGHKALVELLIQEGADVNSRNKAGWTPHRIAVAKGYADLAKLLIRAGATVDASGIQAGEHVAASQPPFVAPRGGRAGNCSRCGIPMVIVSNMFVRSDVPTQGCFQCQGCGCLTCYNCSDNRQPCECGAQAWAERTYVLQ